MLVVVTHKNNGHVSTVSGNKITLSEPSIVKLALSPRDVVDFQRTGEDLLIHLHNGTTIRIANFYKYFINNQDNDLVLEDSDGKLWAGHHSDGLADFNFAEIQSVDQLVEKDRGILPILLGLGGLGGIGAAVAGASGGGGDRGAGGQPGENDHTPPEAPVVKLENDTGIVGDGITKDGNVIVNNLEAGATWEYSIDGGKTWKKGSGNSFELAPGDYENGDVLVRQIDQAGNISSNGSLGEVTVDVTAPGAEFVLSDPEGDNIPTATGTTEPNSDVTVTWPDGTQTEVTADGSGEWSATAPGVQPDGDVSVVVTDPAGNSGTGNESWTADDITPPDTSGTTVSVGTIAGDGVVNASEAAGSVAIIVTIANPPADAATTAVNVLIDGVAYAATDNGDGTWTASVPGSVLAGATTPTVIAEAVFTDAAGNDADPVTGSVNYSVDVTAPGAEFVLSDPEGDNIPTATGTTEPNSDVTVTWPDGTQTEVTADGSGEWSATAPGVQPDGDVSVVVTDPAGNSGTGNESWTADDITPPDTSGTTVSVGTIAGDGVVNASEAAGSVAIIVTIANPPADAATTAVNVLIDGVAYAATDNGDGTWTASVPGSVLAGATTPTVIAEAVFTDAAGNDADPVTGSVNYSVDVTAPGAEFVLSDPEGDNIPTATGTTEPNSDVTVTWPDGTQTEVTADGSGEWSATAPGVQPDGDVSVVVTDPAGNSGTGNESWTADDITPPDTSGTTVSVGTIAGDGVVNASEAAGSVAIIVTIANPPADAATTAVNVLIDGVAYAATDNGDGTWTASVPGSVLAGATTPTVIAEAVFTDAAGNDADPVTGSVNYSVDVTAPGAEFVLSDPEGDNIPTATGTTEPNSDVTVTWPDGTQTEVTADGSGEWSATAPGVQPDGDVSVVVTDPAGNSGTGNESWTADDITPPDTSGTTVSVGTIAGDGVVNASEAAGSVAIIVTIANPPADAATTAVNVLIDGVAYAATDNGDGTWTASVPGSVLAGATTPTVIAEAVFTDAAGNDADPVTGSVNYSVDVTAPGAEFVLSDPEGDNIPTATGTTEPNSDVTVTWPDGTQTEVTADGSGEWSATAPGVQPDGDVSVVVTDPAGNSGTGNESWTADDITPPDTSGTTVSVGTIAGDGVVNASEAAGSVAIIVTIANPPADAATTAVNVLIDGVAYAATDNGDGTWTASVPGSVLAGATTPTVIAEAVFTDAAGNDADPVTGSVNYSVDVTAPGAEFVLSDPEGDNIPTATGTTEPNSDVTVTWPDGTQTEVTADGSGEWSATAPGVQPDGDVSVVVTDPAGNSGTGNESWTADDITPPDTSGTTVSVGTIAGDGVVNASEAAGSVAIIVTIANPPADAATTAVNVLIDGVAYAATDNGDGTWTASVPGSVLAGATTPTVIAEAVFTDAAGNDADPVTGSVNYSVDVTAPGAEFVLSDPEGDNIPTATGTTEPNSDVTVTWPDGTQTEVTADGSGEWSATAPGVQPDGDVSVVVTDPAGNSGTGNESWTADDITPPDTSGTTVSVGTIAGDGVVNASEAAGSVAIIVTIANPPADAATTAVNVLIDGVAYAATDNGDGTWTASVPGSVLAGATTPTVIAEAVFTDAAGNDADPVTGSVNYSVDVTAPGAEFVLSDPEGDNIPTATGTTEPNSDVTVTWPDGTQTEVTADGSGEWSATAPGVQPDGDVSVVVTDPAGNSGTGNESWTADDITPPDTSGTTVSVGTIAGDGVVNASEAAGSVAIIVTIANPPADAATTAVNVLIDGVAYAATDNGDGTWTASVPGSVLAGATTPTVIAEAVFTDAAGNDADPVTGSVNYSVDVTAPGAEFVLSDPEGDNIPTATGTTEPNSDVTVTWPDGTQTEVTADGSGEWSATAPGVQPDGDVSVVVTDPAGNSGTGNESWTADDITPPDTSGTTVSVGTIAGDGVVNASEAAGSVAIIVTIANPPADAATTAVNVLIDGVAYAATDNGDGTWTASVPGSVLAGATTPTVIAEAVFTDAAGNDADPVTGSVNYSVDVTAPGAEFVLSDPEGDNIPTATGTTEPNSDVTVTWPDGTQTEVTADGSGEWSATAPGVQPDGDVSVVVTDPAGNSGTGNESWTADDITPPDTSGTTVSVGTIAGDGVVNASEAAGSVAIIVTIANPPADAATTAVNVLIDGVAYAATDNGDGTWTASVPGSVLAGATTPTVIAEAVFTDAAGNDADPVTGSVNYSVDVTAPGAEFVLSDPEGDNIPTATGTTEPNSDVTVTWPDGTQTEVTADGSGEWSATAPGVQPDGDVSVVVTDPAGNSGTGNESWTADDITPPDTSGTTVSVGTIAGDGVVNASEAAGSVAIIVTIANPPADAATTAVNVLIDGVAYAATDNGDGTWTASVPGSVLAGATTPTVIAEAVFTDAAGNDADPVTGSVNYSVDVTAPGAEFVLSDPEGDNIPTATGTTEPNSDVTVTWPDGTQTEVTADGSGEWSATAPGVQPDGDVSVVVTDPAGNSGTGNESWTADDITPPDTSGTTVSVGTIAGDGVVNASEAAGSVAIIVTIANPPADAATTAVNVLIDGVAYAATDNGDGTWTASVPGSVLAGATTPTVIAEAVFTDAAGNDADPVTGSVNYSVDVTAPGAEFVLSDPEGDNIPTATGTTEPNSDVTVTWPDGTQTEVTADGSGEWSATAPGVQPDGDVSVVVTDPAGNSGTGNESWTADDITPPDTSGTTVSVGTIAGDGVVNASEAAGSVAIIVTIANPPADAATTAVNVLIDGVAYAATDNGDGTWTASVPGSVLAGATTPTVIAEAVFTDAAGNDADPVTGSVNYSVDVTAPGAPALELANDTGTDGDGISSVGTITVTNLESGAQWEYSTDNGVTWSNGTGTSFVLPLGDYAAGTVQVRQTDSVGNTGTAGSLGATSIISLQGANDAADADMGTRESVTHAPVSDENLQLLGLLDNGSQAAGVSFTVGQGSIGDIVIQVSQNALIAVADAFNVEIYDAAGNLVHVLTTGNDPLVGDVLGTGILGLTGDNTLVANITGLAPGEYKVVVRKGESALGTLLDADGNGVSLQELGQGGVVLGQENQALVLAAVENALNGALLPGLNLPLGTVVKNILLPVLDTTTALGAGDLVEVLSNSLNALGLSHLLDQVLGAVAHALLNNTLTLIQDTSVSVSLTEHSFADGDTPVSGNVIDPDINASGEAGEDQVVPGTKVTQIENSDGEVIQLNNGSATIAGNHGTLVINADGSYTYTPNGSPASVGQSDTFSYTISDGTNSTTANLTINIDGALVTNDTAQAGIEYEYLVTAGVNMNDAINDSWALTLFPRERTSASLTVAQNTTQDVTLNIDAGNLLGLGGSVVVYVEVRTPGTNTWTSHATYSSSQLLSLLGSGGPGKILVPDLDAGEYRIRTVTTGVGVAGSFSVDITSEVTHLDQYAPNPHAFSAHGDLFANDLVGADIPPLSISHDGTTFTNVVSGTPQVVQGAYGSLQINADGTYTYTPDSRASVGGEYTDTFTYRIEHNGTYQEATLTVTINTTVQGDTVDSGAAMVAFSIGDADVVPMNDLLADADDTPAGQDHNMADLLQDFAFDDGGNDVTLPFSDTMSDEFEPASIFTENLTAPQTTMIPEDPLAHLVLDPLIKDDDLHSMHIA